MSAVEVITRLLVVHYSLKTKLYHFNGSSSAPLLDNHHRCDVLSAVSLCIVVVVDLKKEEISRVTSKALLPPSRVAKGR